MQTNYSQEMDSLIAGMKIDSRYDLVVSKTAKVELPFGVVAVRCKGSDDLIRLPMLNKAVSVADADLVTDNSIVATVNDTALDPVSFSTSHDSTMEDIASAIEAVDAVESAVADGRTITAVAVDGSDISLSIEVTGGSSQATFTTSYETADDIDSDGFLVGHTHATEESKYPADAVVSSVEEGALAVVCETAMTPDDTVYVRFTGTGTVGAVRNDSDSGKAVAVPSLKVIRSSSGAGLVALKIR